MTLKEIAEAFIGNGSVESVKPFGCGNINKSYLVRSADDNYFILQRINTHVFKNPTVVMNNILTIIRHFEKKHVDTLSFLQVEGQNKNYLCEGYLYYDEFEPSYWRCAKFIDAVCFEHAKTQSEKEAAGVAFGRFLYDCSDIDIDLLNPTITDFHCITKRIQRLNNEYDRYCIHHTDKRVDVLYNHILSLLANVNCRLRDILPDRVTHNDTKIANLLFKNNGDNIIVIDLDTVMAGKITDDFGDAARSIASFCSEDERDLSLVGFDIESFACFVRGYRQGVKNLPSEVEVHSLFEAPAYVTAELACRFLTDYLSGNKYFKIEYEEHNLVRAANQSKLLGDIIAKKKYISEVIIQHFF